MGNNSISHKIDAYAQANLKALKQEEAKTGKHLTKYDIAERMVKSKKLTSGELNSWLKTTEGNKECSLSAAQKNALKNTSAWTIAGFGGVNNDENAHYTARLENASKKAKKNPVEKQNAISGFHMKLNETVAERKKRYAELEKQIQEQKAINPKKALEEQKFKAHIDSVKLSEADANKTASQLTREIEQQDVEMMSHDDRKKFIMDKFQDAAAKKDISGMKNALLEFNSYMCKYIDDKVGVTDVKDAIKEYSGLNKLVDYVDNLVDDGDETNLSKLETAWNITKGLGDAVDGFIGAEGIEMVGALGTASKVATIANAGKYFAVATQGYFGVEGSQLIGAGLAHAQTAETEEEARLAGSELGMGTIMLGGAVKSAKQGYRNIKIKQSDAFAREYVKTANDQALVDEYNARENYGVTVSLDIYKNELIKRGYKPNEHGYFETPKPTRPSTYRDELPTPDYSKTRENFPADAHQSLSKPGKANAMEIVKDQVPSAYKIVKPGTEIQTKEGPRVVQDGEIVVYDTDGDPYVMPKKNFLKRQEPLKGDAESEALYAKLKNGEAIPDTEIATDGNATKTSAKTFVLRDVQLRTKLTEFKGSDGKPFLTESEINNIIQNCQEGFITDGKPIPNYEAKIEAVLNNPEEVASISGWKSRSAGIWRAIQDPLSSTVEANPELFGAKPKAEVKGGNNTAKANVGNSSIENLKAFFEDPKYECMSDFLKNKDILTNNDVIKTDIITDAYGDKLPVIITKIPLKTESGTSPAGSQLRIHAGTLDIARDIDYSNVKVSLGQVLKNGEWSDAITIQLDMSKDKATITQLNYMTDTYGYAGGLYLNAFPDLAAIIAKSAKTTVEASPEAFGAKPKAEVKTDIKTQTKSSSMSPDIRNSLIEDLKNVKYDKQVTIDTMDQYPEFVEELVNFKVDGKQFFSMRDVNDIIYNCLSGDDGPKAKPESIRNILNNPSEISFMRDECKNKAVGLWIALFR